MAKLGEITKVKWNINSSDYYEIKDANAIPKPLTAPTSGQFLKFDGTDWIGSALPSASTSAKGIVRLTSSYTSTSTTYAANGKAVSDLKNYVDSQIGLAMEGYY